VEKDKSRKKLMKGVVQRTTQLYKRLFALLKSKYYAH